MLTHQDLAYDLGAQERTRTFTAVKPLAPEASASTNSATWAQVQEARVPRLRPLASQTRDRVAGGRPQGYAQALWLVERGA